MREVAYEEENKTNNNKRDREVLENPMLFVKDMRQ